MTTLTIELKEQGLNHLTEMRNQLDDFVQENFNLLYEGAVRLNKNIEKDYYAPKRVQINDTRLHERQGLKYAAQHKYNEDSIINEQQLKQTIKDLQSLIDAASKEIKSSFSLEIVEIFRLKR